MGFTVRRFTSNKVLATTVTREAAESFADDYVTEHGGVLMIEETTMTAKPKPLTATQTKDAIAAALDVDAVSVSKGVYTVRRAFFFRHGYTAEKLVERVRVTYPKATIIDSGEVWKAFSGGHTVAQGSHWFVKFTLPKE